MVVFIIAVIRKQLIYVWQLSYRASRNSGVVLVIDEITFISSIFIPFIVIVIVFALVPGIPLIKAKAPTEHWQTWVPIATNRQSIVFIIPLALFETYPAWIIFRVKLFHSWAKFQTEFIV
jgi:hypothetical protein